ncbi:hypothetical protein [Ferruginivarius sediminum]|uniref:hypothetical protein n=1 Tax=Ferruginivarius sediminum TaxID=2661937 RepID=UPI0011C0235D|nr:hypothetical protein [Ferruginivarius sediminum]
MAHADYRKVREAVERVVRERFNDVRIVSVDVTPDLDEDGQRILMIDVVFSADKKHLDSRKTVGLTRHVLPKLHEVDEPGFPVFSFIADSEMRKSKTEAA